MDSVFKLVDQKYKDAKTITDAIGKTIACPSVAYTTYIENSGAVGAGGLAAAIIAGGPAALLAMPIIPQLKKIWEAVVKKIKARQKRKEKEALLKDIIAKQQVIINKLNEQNRYNQEEIKNLKDALDALKEVQSSVNSDFGLA